MSFSYLFLAVLIASTAASPFSGSQQASSNPSPLKVVLKANFTNGIANMIANDRRRIKSFTSHKLASNLIKTSSITTLLNEADHTSVVNTGFLATADVQVGGPPSTYTLTVDTGSSNTFIGANSSYVATNSSKNTGEQVAVTYAGGSFSGEEFTDNVGLGGYTIVRQSIGVASKSQGFNGVDGILGLGPDTLTLGTLVNHPTVTIPTVTDNLAKQGKIKSALVGVNLPLTPSDSSETFGSLDFGVPDTSQFTSALNYVPVTAAAPANQFWGIDQSISYGDQLTNILDTTAGIVDTGTTLLYIATEAFDAYVAATGATMDKKTGLLRVSDPTTLQSLSFQMGQNNLIFTADAQIFPRSLNTQIGGGDNITYLIIQDIGYQSGQGLDFVNGYMFLQRFYSVFDTPNKQVGFAYTSQTGAMLS